MSYETLESQGVRVQIGDGIQTHHQYNHGIQIGGGFKQSVYISDGHMGYGAEDRSGLDRFNRERYEGDGFLARRFGR